MVTVAASCAIIAGALLLIEMQAEWREFGWTWLAIVTFGSFLCVVFSYVRPRPPTEAKLRMPLFPMVNPPEPVGTAVRLTWSPIADGRYTVWRSMRTGRERWSRPVRVASNLES
jgi:hypothetical protein